MNNRLILVAAMTIGAVIQSVAADASTPQPVVSQTSCTDHTVPSVAMCPAGTYLTSAGLMTTLAPPVARKVGDYANDPVNLNSVDGMHQIGVSVQARPESYRACVIAMAQCAPAAAFAPNGNH